MRIAPCPREDGRIAATVGSSLELSVRIAPGSHENGPISAAIASPPREPGRRNALGPGVDDTSRNISRAFSTTSSFEAPTMSRRDSQGVGVALRCGYESKDPQDRPGRSARGLHARPVGTSRSCTINKEYRNVVNSGLHPVQSERLFVAPRRLAGGQRTCGGQVSPTGLNRSYTLAANLRAPLPR